MDRTKALEAVTREFDRLGPETDLTEKILEHYRIERFGN